MRAVNLVYRSKLISGTPFTSTSDGYFWRVEKSSRRCTAAKRRSRQFSDVFVGDHRAEKKTYRSKECICGYFPPPKAPSKPPGRFDDWRMDPRDLRIRRELVVVTEEALVLSDVNGLWGPNSKRSQARSGRQNCVVFDTPDC